MLTELLLNLVSEAVGILVTVFIIGRLLKIQEERRWLPLKHFVYAKLLEIIGELLIGTLPSKFIRQTNIVYEYGLVSAFPQAEIIPPLDEIKMTDLLSEIDQLLQRCQRLDVNLLFKSKQQIDDTLSKSAFLLEPEFLTLVLELDRSLSSVLRFEEDWSDDHARWNRVLGLTQVALTAIDVRAWLDQKVSNRLTAEVTTEEMLKETRKLNSKLRRNVYKKSFLSRS